MWGRDLGQPNLSSLDLQRRLGHSKIHTPPGRARFQGRETTLLLGQKQQKQEGLRGDDLLLKSQAPAGTLESVVHVS
jgi:hypothetical protein